METGSQDLAREILVRLADGHADEGLVMTQGMRHDAAFLKIDDPGSGRYAVVWTPGNRWISLDFDGGFAWTRFDEEITPEELTQTLEDLFGVAVGYLTGTLSIGRRHSKLAGTVLIVEDGPMELELTRSLSYRIRQAMSAFFGRSLGLEGEQR